MAMSKLFAVALSLVFFSACVYLSYVQSLVPSRDVLFSVCAALYCLIANIYLRKNEPYLITQSTLSNSLTASNAPTSSTSSISPRRAPVRLLFPFTLVFSLAAPISILILASANGLHPPHSKLHALVAPHLFLITAQILCETIAFLFSPFFTIYIRFNLTIAFVSYRLAAHFKWYTDSLKWARSREAANLPNYLVALSQATALLNIVFWTFALLIFLLLYCLPALIDEPFQPKGSVSTACTPSSSSTLKAKKVS